MLSLQQLLSLFCHVDDFCRDYEPAWKRGRLSCSSASASGRTRNRARSLTLSEIMTLLIAFHQGQFRNFKIFYLGYVCRHWRGEFPGLVSYTRFLEYAPSVIAALFAYLRSLLGACSGLSFLDSTDLAVCHNRRIHQHKVFKGLAKRGKTSTGWFYGFKLHLLISDSGELLNVTLTPGDTDDRKPVVALVDGAVGMSGKIVADKGYISQRLFTTLFERGIQLITKSRKGMKARLMLLTDRLLLRKRALVETVIDQLKNLEQVEHTRHRSQTGFLWNLAAALIAYCHQDKKPSVALRILRQLETEGAAA